MSEMRFKKQNFLFILSVLSVLVLTNLVSGVLDVPVEQGNYSTTLIVNCTQATLPNIVNASVRRSSSANGGAATTVLIEAVNTTDVEYYNSGVDISGVTDGIGYNLTCIFYNSTAGISVFDEQVAGVANITIDNTRPTVTSTVSKDRVEFMSNMEVTGSCSDALDFVPSVTTRIWHKGTSGTTTITTSPYTLASSDLNVIGENIWNVICTDSSSNFASNNKSVNIESEDEIAPEEKLPIRRTRNIPAIVFIVIAIAIVVIIVVVILTLTEK